MRRKRRTKAELPPIICGIYYFEVVGGNPKKIGWKYIGQAEDIYDRKEKHLNGLRGKYHTNNKLKNYFNKYGEKSLRHGILFKCEKKDLDFWEKFFIKCFNSYKAQGFNLTRGGDDKSFQCKKCKLQNMETGEIVECESIKEFCNKFNLNRETVGRVLLGKSNFVGDWFNPQMKWRPKTYELKDPSGNIHKFCKIKKFCEKHSLNDVCIFSILSGQNINHKGWTLPNPRERLETFHLEFSFISPNGEIFSGKNVRKFAQEHNLNDASLREVLHGNITNHFGWRKYKDGDKIEKFIFNEYKFVSPDGKLVVVQNMAQFARENGLEEKNLHKVFKKERNHHGGWRKYEEGMELTKFKFKENYKLVSPENRVFDIPEIKCFAKENNLNAICLYRVYYGKSKSHRGWTKYKEISNG